ncbi:NADPH-dependent aldehyde reductase Ahr [Humisphaera borealis]|uniref:alcohol dehydrogenase (NADP(+)) n=1 Tax=Humisphaera borealis TaxID=2807512 RepID=A0A7M2WTG0_9BACT|nr:NAD(P)-dependent alcohol dehydrogenase [Humisphaera borealis]QOV88723.1 NAD(P)-dependent alcohol dehydrogenase [Humisphaera borealis]
MIHAYAAEAAKAPLKPFSYDPGSLKPEQIEIAVQYCGICHSDLSMLDNDWGMAKYPFVPGHEVVGKVAAIGELVTRVKVGDTVGLGWYAGSCLKCSQCMSGNHNLCPTAEQTIIGRHGGFADKVRCDEVWATKLPDHVDAAKAGPLFCGGITVFNPIVQFGVQPTDRVAVIGIGGLGHLALQFLKAWGCEVTAFTTSDSKREEAMKLGAHQVVNTKNAGELKKLAGSLDFILNTANASPDWDAMFGALAPKGRFHTVGVIPEPIPAPAFTLISGQKSVSGSPLGSPYTVGKMLDFCGRHDIAPVTEIFPMKDVNAAIDHLRAGKARYRVVLAA